MTIAHLLEDFELDISQHGQLRFMSEDRLEEFRLNAFETGYSAGWEDATSAANATEAQVVSSMSQAFEDMEFTYQEAMSQMTMSLGPMFNAMVETVLPAIADAGLVQNIASQLEEMAQDQMSQPALLVVPAGVASSLRPMLQREFSFPVQIIEESSLPPGRACLRVGIAEREIDCSHLLRSITTELNAFLHQPELDRNNG